LGVQDWIVGRMFDLLGGWARASLLWAVCCVVWWGAVARLLYRKAIFIKL
jgi:Co/Zn/Cd efflux system component